jgi:Tat protein secretion system quality control protein TatD with DNase activity
VYSWRLADSHGHLRAAAFAVDADEVAVAARLAGVERILAAGWDRASSRAGTTCACGTSARQATPTPTTLPVP